ncbi:hypothetical protein HDU87_003607 [Geranomyces variabilis]|uniref:U6 small nuclear RNA (adenine-(43)-N(6))-methyltransferase n=1 Tax=Geranomyces variabilis TaxID=109894 RepID=A0AAD5TLM1_9FUNG|nr:hypothetical protein HDU87_003607 [Geranomyces variabilis]
MHERNPFNDRPNFAELARQYEHLAPYLRPNWQGVLSIDFKDAQALRELTYALLWTGFGLRLEIPLDMLCPPVPNRLDYVLTIEDLLAESGIPPGAPVHGIDIGTGASCIYALLACKRNEKWKMLGLDIEPRAIAYATSNVAQNELQSRITVCKNETDLILHKDLLDGFHPKRYDFTMCNPPFYESAEQIARSRAGKEAAPRAVCSGTSAEMVTEGGELGFILRILAESARPEMRRRVRWFTSLVGRKEDVASLEDAIRAVGGARWEVKSLRQGATVRWVISWTFIGLYEVLSDNEGDVKPTGYFGAAVKMIPRKVIRPPVARKARKPQVSLQPATAPPAPEQQPVVQETAKAETAFKPSAVSPEIDDDTSLPETLAVPAEPHPPHSERRSKKRKGDKPTTPTPSKSHGQKAVSPAVSASKIPTDSPPKRRSKKRKEDRSEASMPSGMASTELSTKHRSKKRKADLSSTYTLTNTSAAGDTGDSVVKSPASGDDATEEPVAKKYKKSGAGKAKLPPAPQPGAESTAEQANAEGSLTDSSERNGRSATKVGRRKAAKASAGAAELQDAVNKSSEFLPGSSSSLQERPLKKSERQLDAKLRDVAHTTAASNGATAEQSDATTLLDDATSATAGRAMKKQKMPSKRKKQSEQDKGLALEPCPAESAGRHMRQLASAAAKQKLRQRLRTLLGRQRANVVHLGTERRSL